MVTTVKSYQVVDFFGIVIATYFDIHEAEDSAMALAARVRETRTGKIIA